MARARRHKSDAVSPAARAIVRIDGIGAQGDGVARREDGASCFVPLTAPGDVVEAEFRAERGRLLRVVEPGPDRRTASCPQFGACGGCAVQHVEEAAYRRWKEGLVSEALARRGLGDVRAAPLWSAPAASRRRASFVVSKVNRNMHFGFNQRRSSIIVDVGGCVILHPDLHGQLGALRALCEAFPARDFDLSVTLCDNGLDINITNEKIDYLSMSETERVRPLLAAARAVRLCVNGAPMIETAPPIVTFDGVAVAPPPGCFLQASREAEARMIALVCEAVKGARKVVDLFSGCGAFALPLAKSATVRAFDADPAAIEALSRAARSAQASGLNPVEAQTRDLFERPLTAKELKGVDAVVFDPPRAGAEAQAEMLAQSAVPVVVGVSCNPASFARDAAILSAGGYQLDSVQPIDQFVYSAHVELVAVFRWS